MAIGFGAAATLLLGSAFLIASLVGMARGSLGYRRRLAGAFATLLPCLLSLPLANSLRTIEGHSFDLSRYQAHEGVPEVGGEIIQKAQQGLLARTENRTGGLIAFIHGDQGPRVQRPLPKPSGPLPLREYTYELNQKPASSSVSTAIDRSSALSDGPVHFTG